ncbi:rhomboid-like protein [Streptacidiphilus neutrinimicus]|uniref:rhomboid-like protein n=1 Tax=Streptacidiphilus neutrinimicus TaxID=105420 RepID=UPI0005A81135|nr:rhomboid-like protein [Streptacidiphilus neutrinimicus]
MDRATAKSRIGRAWRAVRRYVRRAPGTFVWLTILFATTVVLRHVNPHTADRILRRHSTNLHYLSVSPIRVLITSGFYIAGGGWFFYFVLYNIFHVPAERWLGTVRWLAVVLIAHVGATYISEGVLLWAIDHDMAPEKARYTLDYGVSYALAGIEAVLVYLITKPWRYVYAAGLLLFYAFGVVRSRDFTSIGHLSAVLLGLACYPLTRSRPGSWDPAATARTLWRRLHRGRARADA